MLLTFAELSLTTLRTLVQVTERGIMPAHWEQMQTAVAINERQQVEQITAYLLNCQLTLMNEATIWSRAIYPLLLLAEANSIQAWAQISLRAAYPRFTLEGLVDGVLGHVFGGMIDAPYLIVVEAKRGLEGQNPQAQLYGTMLAAAWQNQQRNRQEQQEMYGCYTIGDNWTFVHGLITGFENDLPSLTIQYSREYAERLEAITILQILKYIVRTYLTVLPPLPSSPV